jgi:hypothetical protein
MIVAECNKLEQEIQELRRLKQLHRQTEEFQMLAVRLTSLVTPFADLLKTFILFRKSEPGVGAPSMAEYVAQTGDLVSQARELFQAGAERLLDRNVFRLREFSDAIGQVESVLRSQLHQRWQNYTRPHVLDLDLNVLTVLEQIPSLKQSVQTVRLRLGEVNRLCDTLPKADAEIQTFHTAAQALKTAWGNLGGRDIPSELLEFIKAAAGSGFSLAHFSESLRQQLQHRDWLKYFVIRIRRDGSIGLTR